MEIHSRLYVRILPVPAAASQQLTRACWCRSATSASAIGQKQPVIGALNPVRIVNFIWPGLVLLCALSIRATLVLHTRDSALTHRPDVHGLVPGGGLAPDGTRWVSCKPGFFLSVRVLSRLFRRRFLEALAKAHRAGKLQFFGERADPSTDRLRWTGAVVASSEMLHARWPWALENGFKDFPNRLRPLWRCLHALPGALPPAHLALPVWLGL